MAIKVERFVVSGGDLSLEPEANFYLIESEGEAVLIDSGFYSEETKKLIEAIARKWNLKAAFITHLHEDHAGGIPFLRELGVKIFLHRDEKVPPSFKFEIEDAVFRVKEGLRLFFRGFTVRLCHTPGHTRGHISPYVEEEKILFSGDTILSKGTPWVGPPEGDMKVYMETLKMLRGLDIRVIYSGHGEEIANPGEKIDEYIAHRLEREKQIIKAIESGKKSIEEITDYVYDKEDLPEHVVPFARLTVLAHLDKLKKEGRVFQTSKTTYELLKGEK